MNNKNIKLKLLDDTNHLDSTTKLNIMNFFVSQYDNYINLYPNSNLVFFDFVKLKRINDEFTHCGGNQCLVSFANVLKTAFPNSLIARIHGDEFLLLTNLSKKEINKILDESHNIIKEHFDTDFIPVIYKFSAGVVSAQKDIDSTINKADVMMYKAKKNNLTYLNFNQDIYDQVKEDEEFLITTSNAINSNELILAKRNVFTIDKTPTNIYDVYTRNLDNESIFTEQRLKLLCESSEMKKLDYLNLKKILLSYQMIEDEKIMVNIYANSLFSVGFSFPKYIRELYNSMQFDSNKYIICINVTHFSDDVDELISYLKILQNLDFNIALSSFDLENFNPLLNIWSKIDVKYVKINPELWKNTYTNNKYKSVLKNTVQTFSENDTLTIFMKVENQNEIDYINNFSSNCLIEGNAVDEEKKLII